MFIKDGEIKFHLKHQPHVALLAQITNTQQMLTRNLLNKFKISFTINFYLWLQDTV